LLVEAMAKATNPEALGELAVAVGPVVERLEPGQAADAREKAAALLTEAVRTPASNAAARQLAEGVVGLFGRHDPARAGTLLAGAMTETTDRDILREFGEGLRVVAGRVEPEAVASMVVGAMTRTTDYDARRELATALAEVVARVDPARAGAFCEPAAAILT